MNVLLLLGSGPSSTPERFNDLRSSGFPRGYSRAPSYSARAVQEGMRKYLARDGRRMKRACRDGIRIPAAVATNPTDASRLMSGQYPAILQTI